MAPLHVARNELARLASNGIRRGVPLRGLKTSSKRAAAQSFAMPALSPTMTEGNIAKWSLKEGDSFSAGDVLLEVETDKASMDVEAQDDGILAKIVQQDGSKGIKVGSRIAVLAEPEDDLSSLEIPAEDTQSEGKTGQGAKETSAPKEESSQPSEKEQQTTAREGQSAKEAVPGKAQKQTYPLYPSVAQLLHEKGMDKSEADKIPASGPGGRLLKGDVLSYLGTIKASYSSEQSARISKLGHLDLSNIKVVQPKQPEPPAPAEDSSPVIAENLETEIAVTISYNAVQEVQQRVQKVLGVDVPLETFISRAIQIANTDLPRSNKPPTADELFNDVLGLDKSDTTYARGSFVPDIFTIPTVARPPPSKKSDILDMLAGTAHKTKLPPSPPLGSVLDSKSANVFSLIVEKGEEKRARLFLERVKTILQVDPGRLVL